MDAKHKQLVGHCVELLTGYNRETTSMEHHLDQYLQLNKLHDDDDIVFLQEVFAGCVCHRDVLKVVTQAFFIKDGQNVLRSCEEKLQVIIYLALFRLDEIGMAHFRKFLSILDVNTAHKILNLMFDERNLFTWIRDEWNKVYEQAYVQTNLISPVLRWLPEVKDLINLLEMRIENKLKLNKTTAATTEIKPFNLTKPRARSIPIPDKIPKLMKSKPAATSTYTSPKLLGLIEKQKAENRRKAEEDLMKSSELRFSCANPKKSFKPKKVIEGIIVEQNSKVEAAADDDGIKATTLLDYNKKPLPVKMTMAAIMREAYLYQKQENEIIKKLNKLEAGSYDVDDFHKWQEEKKQQEMEMKHATVETRRLQGKLSHEEAILARTNLVTENQENVRNMKEKAAALVRGRMEERQEQDKQVKKLVEDVMSGQRNAREAIQKRTKDKQKIVQEVKEESKELMRLALQETEAEMRSKMEMIQQIRAMEATPTSHVKMVDLTATAGLGLLGEMSLAELRERLAIIKTQRKEDEDNKRDNIISIKQAKAEAVSETMDMVAKFRSERIRSAACKLELHKQNKQVVPPFKNEAVAELELKLQETKERRLQEQKKLQLSGSKGKDGHLPQKVWSTFYQCSNEKMEVAES